MGRILGKLAAAVLLLILSAPKGYAQQEAREVFGDNCFSSEFHTQKITKLKFSVERAGLRIQSLELNDIDLFNPEIKINHKPLFNYPMKWNLKNEESQKVEFHNTNISVYPRISTINFKEITVNESYELIETMENSLFISDETIDAFKQRFEAGEDFVEVIIDRVEKESKPAALAAKAVGRFSINISKSVGSFLLDSIIPSLNANEATHNDKNTFDFDTGEVKPKKVKRKIGTTHFRMFCPKSILQPLS